jgi:outer membrane protein assembly factor BamB
MNHRNRSFWTRLHPLCVGFMALLMQCSQSPGVAADDWPQWRGPQRDGKSPETGLLANWPEGGPKLVWQANDLGNGYSTPVVVGDALYVLSNQGKEYEEVIALSTSNGSKLWSTKIGTVAPNQGPQYPGTRSTPTVDGDALYALASDGNLVCLDIKSGKQRWGKNLKNDFDGVMGMWAYTESPLIDGNALICSPGGGTATVVALNKKNGEVIWKASLEEKDAASYSSPIVATIDGTKQYVLYLGKGVVGLRADTGELLWRYTKTSDAQANIATPVVNANFVYTGASRVGGGLVQVSGKKSDPKEIYFAKTLPGGMGGCVLVNGYLYGSTSQGNVCVDYATGEIKWKERGIGTSSMCYADGRLYLHGEDNSLAMLAATPEGYKELGRCTPPNAPDRGNSKAWTHPIIANGKLYIRDQSSIWCYDIAK